MMPIKKLFNTITLNISLDEMKNEIFTNRRAQFGMALLVFLIAVLFWPDSNKSQRRISGIESNSLVALKSLPDLSALDYSSEIPPLPKLLRDPFLFSAPLPSEVIKKVKALPPPPPPTPEEIKQKEIEEDRQLEMSTAPSEYRFIGFIKTNKTGIAAAFITGEEPASLKKGSIIRGRWKLIEINEDNARFQNLKYSDLFFTASANNMEN